MNEVDYGWGGVYNLELFGNDSITILLFDGYTLRPNTRLLRVSKVLLSVIIQTAARNNVILRIDGRQNGDT
jgi:hypothetical protein